MSKEMISIPEGNLLRVALTKSITTLSALNEKTGVDRKTLRAINAGRAVKQTTLQSIADRLRIPIAHLQASNEADQNEGPGRIDDYQYREIKLQQLDGAALRKLAGETDEITWFLNIDRISIELESALKNLQKCLKGWFFHLNLANDPDDDNDNLLDAISYVKTSGNIDETIKELARHKLKIFGGTYIAWQKEDTLWNFESGLLPVLKYRSQLKAALSIVPEAKNYSTVRAGIGFEPPQNLSELSGIYFVEIDGKPIRVREINFGDDTENHQLENPDDIPF
jgi:hypothetical protein